MSADSRPISAAAFTEALLALPLSSLYAKLFELRNSIAHLERSNDELKGFADASPDGDKDCEEAIEENKVVVKRMEERVELVKIEMEKRGHKWTETNGTPGNGDGDGPMSGGESVERATSTNADLNESSQSPWATTRTQGDDDPSDDAQGGVSL